MADYRVVVEDKSSKPRGSLVYSLPPREPFVSKRKEDAFWMRIGDEVTGAAVLAELPFESVTVFMKKARSTSGKTVSLYGPETVVNVTGERKCPDGEWGILTKPGRYGKGEVLMDDEKLQFEEAKLIAEEIAKRNRDFLPDDEEEIITPDELEDLIRGD